MIGALPPKLLRVVHARHALRWRVTQAPESEEVVWHYLHIPARSRAVRRFLAGVITFLSVVFYTIPIAFVASLTTLENLERLLSFIKAFFNIAVVGSIVKAYLPQLALLLFLALLPQILLALSRLEGYPSQALK